MVNRNLFSSSSQSQSDFKSSLPAVAVFLDDSLIPSLPGPGGKLEHLNLIGRPKMPPPLKTIIVQRNSMLSSKQMAGPRHNMISKTFDVPGMVSGIEMHRACILGNRAGIGSAHGRNLSAGSVDHRICRSDIGPRRIGSFQHLQNYGTRTRHGRTASDPTAEEVPQAAKINMGELRKPERSTPFLGTADGLKLGRSGEKKVVKLLATIQALIPVDRMPKPVPPPPATCILAPACFLTPMAIVLETLVWKREMLKNVFGDVAGMYEDMYGFVRGWWDENSIKSAAKEVGSWGDLFDV
ncbi:uncharacterized protein IAS62_002944 [Cryptococcus decagattii]|uniref:Uncharacterized protein n=1 Tax=Cryptococcus decagattii TaxID=1859122 RepID=A0ABZ2ASY2_9TREE